MRQAKRLKATIIAAILAVLAVSAIASATATAAAPEFLPGAAGTQFTGKSGAGTLSSPSGSIECTGDTTTGELTGATKKQGLVSIDFTGCKAFGLINAHSLGDSGSTILAHAELELCFIKSTSPLEVGVLTLVLPLHIEVGTELLEVTGDAVGKITPLNTSTKVYSIAYKETNTKQEPAGCEGQTESLKTSKNEGTAVNSGEQTTEETTFTTVAQTLDG
jgi:hypothetical protein